MINNDWKVFLHSESQKDYFVNLWGKVKEEYKNYKVYPKIEDIFNAFYITPIHNTKVIILGQDCYHGEGQAMGLSFSVREGVAIPPSLKNIYKEIKNEGFDVDNTNGDLTRWAEQGVFLLNSTLTVREGQPNSHSKLGWQIFTDNAIKLLNDDNNPKVFMLWGRNARNKKSIITNRNHLVLESAHPSPLSANNGFFGNNHFRLCNKFLEDNRLIPIDWR